MKPRPSQTALNRACSQAPPVHASVEAVMEMLGLDEHRAKRVRQLSKGNLQRLGLAQSLLREERVVVLDEPTHGLDPVWTQRFRDVVDQLRSPDRAIWARHATAQSAANTPRAPRTGSDA